MKKNLLRAVVFVTCPAARRKVDGDHLEALACPSQAYYRPEGVKDATAARRIGIVTVEKLSHFMWRNGVRLSYIARHWLSD